MNDLKINFLARAKNKLFWMALIPALFLLVQMVAAISASISTCRNCKAEWLPPLMRCLPCW